MIERPDLGNTGAHFGERSHDRFAFRWQYRSAFRWQYGSAFRRTTGLHFGDNTGAHFGEPQARAGRGIARSPGPTPAGAAAARLPAPSRLIRMRPPSFGCLPCPWSASPFVSAVVHIHKIARSEPSATGKSLQFGNVCIFLLCSALAPLRPAPLGRPVRLPLRVICWRPVRPSCLPAPYRVAPCIRAASSPRT